MRRIILACETIKDEVEHVMRLTHCNYNVKWIESGLHNSPVKLNARLQEELDKLNHYDQILMAFGSCGKAVHGLKSGNFEIILPLVDDCFTLLLGSKEIRDKINEETPTYFLTEGWLRGERNIWIEYEYALKKYGEKSGRSIMALVLGNYKRLSVIGLGCNNMTALISQTRRIASELKLDHEVLSGSVDYLTELLTCDWSDDRFLIVPRYSQIIL